MSMAVSRALADVPVAGRMCLEAGAGAGATSEYLAGRNAAAVYAVTRDRDHARSAREHAADPAVSLLQADLRTIPLPEETAELVTAHALLNVVPPGDVAAIASELARVTQSGGELVVVDYTPLEWTGDDPDGTVQELFAVENAASHLARGEPALVFYPPAHIRALFERAGWTHRETRLVTTEVPWGRDLLDAHAEVVESLTADVPSPLDEALVSRARSLAESVDPGEVRHAGGMYAARFER